MLRMVSAFLGIRFCVILLKVLMNVIISLCAMLCLVLSKFCFLSVGIDIPDYISTGGKADAIKSMSNKMKAMGKK